MPEEEKKESKSRNTAQTDRSAARVPPHSLEMERAALCCALIDGGGFSRIVDLLSEQSFYDHKHKLVFEAMLGLFNRNSGIDALTVTEELSRAGNLESAGGAPYIAGLTNEVTTAVYADDYAAAVREKFSLRRMISTGTALAMQSYEAPDAGELLDQALRELFEIYTNSQTGGFKGIGQVLEQTRDYLNKAKDQHGNLTGVGTGFRDLDEITSGFQKGDLVIVAGRPSMGKTAFSLDLARHACMNHSTPVAYFSLEMGAMAIALRLLAASAGINLHNLRRGKLTSADWKNLSMAITSLSEAKFFIDDTGSLGLTELRARARQLKQQHDIGVIFIDYMQLMKPPKAQSREQEVAQISRGLKGLARELDVPVVALSQLSRAVEQRGGDGRPQLSDLRDSGAIEQDADVVMFIYRERQYRSDGADDKKNERKGGESKNSENSNLKDEDNTSEIIIRKQRNGPTGTVYLVFEPEYARFNLKADQAAIDAARGMPKRVLQPPEPAIEDDLPPEMSGDDEIPF